MKALSPKTGAGLRNCEHNLSTGQRLKLLIDLAVRNINKEAKTDHSPIV